MRPVRALHFVNVRELEWRELPDPHVQTGGEAIVHPIASTTCDLDRSIINGHVNFGSDFPIGHECVAEVIEVGDDVLNVRPGDICVVPWHVNCGTCRQCRQGLSAACTAFPGLSGYGAPIAGNFGGLFSELVRVPFADGMLTRLPHNVDPVRAASCGDNLTDAFVAVWKGLSRHPGADVVVVNSLPSLGLFAVQHAMALGAGSVVFIDSDEQRRSLATSLGADAYPSASARLHHARYPVVIGASPSPRLLADAISCVAPGGHLSNLAMVFGAVNVPLWDMYQRDMTLSTGFVSVTKHLDSVFALLESGRVQPERVFSEHPWEQAPTVLTERLPKPVLTAPRKLATASP